MLVCVSVMALGPEAHGYRFFATNAEGALPMAAEAVRWDESVWGPGEMLTWVVADDPGWTSSWTDESGAIRQPPLGSPEEVVPFVREALRTWSDVSTADIRWEASGVDASLDSRERGDGRPTIFVDPEAERGSYAGIWMDRVAGQWELTDCDVPLAPFAAAAIAEDVWWTMVLIHEFGHCLGLHHAGAFPRMDEGRQLDLRGAFGIDPLMSYGNYLGDLVTLARDDRVGASLLRPAPAWAAATGEIAGVVTAADGPAPFVQVFATRLSDGVAAGAVGSFTNEEGAFVIDGLEPGQYLLWAGPLNVLYAHGLLLAQTPQPVLDVTEQALLLPVSVSRGAVTDGVQIDLHATRESQ